MNEKQIQRGRKVRSSFLEAAREIIVTEGVENVSVRRVADMAGYSYAAIYNYFADTGDLLLETKGVMLQDVMAHMMQNFPVEISSAEDFKTLCRRYIDYYVQHPHIFEFFYTYRLRQGKSALPKGFDFNSINMRGFANLAQNWHLPEADVVVVMKTIIYAMHGALVLYFYDNGVHKEDLYADADRMIEYLLKK